jgi:AbrB family looped-hinge helix DNA binding protein
MNPHDLEVYGSVKVGERGQIVIPSDARKKLGIDKGDLLLVISTPSKDGIALIRAELVKEMIHKMSTGLSGLEQPRKARKSRSSKK